MKTKLRVSKKAVKAAADRAEKTSAGEEPESPPTPLDPPTISPPSHPESAVTKRGRPTEFKEEFIAQAEKIYKLGFTDEEAADFFGVSIRTMHRWFIQHPEFRQSVRLGKDDPDDRVERSLFSRAVGYTFERSRWVKVDGEYQELVTKEHLPPDPNAAMAWLKNRRPDKWRDVHQHEVGRPGDFARMSDDELKAQLLEEIKALGLTLTLTDGKLIEDGTKH